MEERTGRSAPGEPPAPPEVIVPGGPPHLADPRALTILTTEHWSLLSARSLVYNEAFARAGMFLTFLTGSLVALGFVSQAGGFGREFLVVATALLGVDVLIGLATLGRISSAGAEEFRALQGMNRLRHAYLEMVPSLEPYFSTSRFDDTAGVLEIYNASRRQPFLADDIVHGLTTTPGMVAMITALAGGGFTAALALVLGAGTIPAIVAAFVAVLGLVVIMAVAGVRVFARAATAVEARFPGPEDAADSPEPPAG